MAKRIIISGGGTGGHIFPAVAIADALKKLHPETEILFVGANGRMEMEKVPAAGYKIEGLDIAGFQRGSILKNLSLPFKVLSSVSKAKTIIKDFKPDAVVGVGGYASGPLLYAASTHNLPILIQEQNSYAGITNKFLAKKAKRICVAFDGMEKFFPADRIIKTGNPIRRTSVEIEGKRAEAFETFNLNPNKKTILVTGGSLGAGTLNKCMLTRLAELVAADVQLIWQTGKYYYKGIIEKLGENVHPNLCVLEFLNRMDLAYAAADVIISRAGAGTIAELCMVKKAVILVPSPNVAEDHQTKNALALVNQNAAVLVKDADAENVLVKTVLNLLKNEPEQQKLSAQIGKLAMPDADLNIAKEVLKITESKIDAVFTA
jgi:UDP-N-acetylglucosamine--N-acetylmuramyl-(pentapeptide) pyrophosphoryl-undecaprenol N-acetylglucosamine transferase